MYKNISFFIILLAIMSSCSSNAYVHICTTKNNPWHTVSDTMPKDVETSNILSLIINPADTSQVIEGFGACFNELGWDALGYLSEKDRDKVLKELFLPNVGANFTICRTPIGGNDFSREWYSYAEIPNDYSMQHFSIKHDKNTLIPFIQQALAYNPNIKIWASPWCPPAWMKKNGHYASRYQRNCRDNRFRNGLLLSQEGHEGTDMFHVDSLHFSAYAIYFRKYIQAYRENGINIFAVMPQNEFNSAQVYPSCVWTSHSLAQFVGKHLGPAMQKEGVKVMFGTVERANPLLVDTVLQDTLAKNYVSGVGFQWAGRGAIADVRRKYPDLLLVQTEQECGNGKNDWKGLLHSWDILKHFIDNGVSIYDYWNIALLEGGVSRWGWAQNSLIVIDSIQHTYRWTPEYYLMKHVSHFVKPNAHYLKTAGEASQISISLLNPNGQLVIVAVEQEGYNRWLEIVLPNKDKKYIFLHANSVNTICL